MATSARVGLMFAGQGSQKAGMGEPWRAVDAWAIVEEIAEASGHDVAELLLEADDETLRRTDHAQISTFALEMVVLGHYRERTAGDDVAGRAGHSLGEYAALVSAGVIEVSDAARVVAARGKAMLAAAEADRGTMIAVLGAPAEAVTERLAPLQRGGVRAWVANLNAPDQVVIAGDEHGIAAARDACVGVGKVVALSVGGAFHSPLMAPAEAGLREALGAAHFARGHGEVVANVDARRHPGGPEWVELLARQLTAPVRWTESVRTLLEGGCTRLVEIGPGTTLSTLAKRIARETPTECVTPG
jgi:[acyl-carrier-protein] S-malonyltransferase